MKIDRVQFTKDEAGWFARNVARSLQILEAKALKEPKTRERTTFKVLASMAKTVTDVIDILNQEGGAAEPIDLILKRKQKLVVRQMVSDMAKGLRAHTIPQYEKDPEKFKDYLVNAKAKAELLEAMERKLR